MPEDHEEPRARERPPAPDVAALRAALGRTFATIPGPSDELLDRWARHAAYVLDEGRRVNLTAITDPDEVAVKHYLDAWRLVELIDMADRDVLDIGTGGGFPGIPIALAVPSARVTLVDGTGKKVAVVERSIDALSLDNARAAWIRAEEHLRHERVHVAIARAVGRLSALLQTLEPVRRNFDLLVCMKGPRFADEIAEAEEAGLLPKVFAVDRVHEYELPAGAGARSLVVLKSVGGRGGARKGRGRRAQRGGSGKRRRR